MEEKKEHGKKYKYIIVRNMCLLRAYSTKLKERNVLEIL